MHRQLLAVVLVAAACAHQPAPKVETPSESTIRSTVLMSTNRAGSQVVTRRGNESIVDFEFNDRGRGPKTHTVVRVDERGVPVSMETTGNNYYKVAIEERLAIDGNRAHWSNTSEEGDGATGAFYSSMYGPPEESAMLVRAALRNGGRVALHPSGEATVRKVGELDLRGTHVTAYEINGLGFTPSEVWLDDQQNLFAAPSSWLSVIREGFEDDVKTLIDAQDARANARIADIARKLTHTPANNKLTIVNARVFDPRSGTLSQPTAINIEGERIVSVGAAQQGNETIDAKGNVVLPGLWDMHTHLGSDDGLLNIAAGITSVRDLGNDSDFVLALKRDFDNGNAIGPRVVLAGLVDGPGPFQGPTNMLAGNEEDAIKVVDFFAAHHYEGLKIYSSVKPELVPVLTKRAHEYGMRVSGHIPAGMRATDAIDAGYDEIQHANMLLLNFMPDVTDTRTPARFTEVGKRAADLDLKSDEVQAFIRKMRDRGIVSDPTVAIFETMFTARPRSVSPSYASVIDRMPPQVRRGFLTGGLPVDETTDAKYKASFQKMLDLVAELHRSGVKIVAGTDALAGFSLHRELELYAKAGISNADVLRIATLTPAEILHREKDLGTIEPGKLADLVIVNGDPLANISDVRKVETVVKGGKMFDSRALYAEMGVK
ncbi:MAG: amidohydrolase family protein [Thermoanaerobaculia bacterium]